MSKKIPDSKAQQLRHITQIQQAERLALLGFWEWDIVEDRLSYCSEDMLAYSK